MHFSHSDRSTLRGGPVHAAAYGACTRPSPTVSGAVVAEPIKLRVTKMTDLHWPGAIQRHFRDVMYTKPVDRGA